MIYLEARFQMDKSFYSFLGLCQKAGKVVSGETGVNNEIIRGKVKLLIIAEDTSLNTKKAYLKKARNNDIAVIIAGNKEDLGRAIGKGYRGLIGLLDINMARNLIRIYEKNKIGCEARV